MRARMGMRAGRRAPASVIYAGWARMAYHFGKRPTNPSSQKVRQGCIVVSWA